MPREELLAFQQLMRELEAYLDRHSGKAALVDPEGKARPIPDGLFRILDQVTTALAAGNAITVAPVDTTMTTQQAADFLGISRPTLVRLLEAGSISFEKPGRHRRVRLQDLLEYQASFRAERRAALCDLQRDSLVSKVQIGNPGDVKRRADIDAE
jgi:excisionase family DNA binding protein